jgi:hypothetical protein
MASVLGRTCQDAVHPLDIGDADGKPWTGANEYGLLFGENGFPPVKASRVGYVIRALTFALGGGSRAGEIGAWPPRATAIPQPGVLPRLPSGTFPLIHISVGVISQKAEQIPGASCK